ncbi:MAG TPA: tetratricopeptide repeat protein [Usitatibacter sp.]|nr:tetratricopeptide repeat protein [Usitatibacter sp.]
MKATQAASIAVGLLLAAAAWAGPAEDFASGKSAYERGDVRTAISFLRNSADQGHAPSQALLAQILDQAEQNEEAVKYFRLAAGQGNPEGYYGLATMYASGEGVPRDLKAAREWMTKAAEAGHPQAVQSMALAYMQGGLDIAEPDRATPAALGWIQKAAAIDSLPAIDRLAVAYRKGDFSLPVDAKKAEELEARARTLRNIKLTPGKKKAKANG